MKKSVMATLVTAMMLFFSSCAVHLGDTTLDLPWWMVTMLSVIPALLIVVLVAWATVGKNAKSYYVCPHCHHRFKPGWRIVFSFHVMDEYSLKCPHCGKRDMCSMSYDQESR